ncbi:MAG TPA: MarR family winged helix-turn-helix transcriptional regulator [Negativicutes bacterium]|nr:MarR family winged helix-turn-helix transcriptional regulator [Negativicutes bacterium]
MKHIDTVYPKNPSHCNCLNVRRASRAVTEFYDKVLKPGGLTVAQLGLLWSLKRAEADTIGGLAGLMRIDRTTLNRNLKPLADAGLLTVSPGRDSRTRQVALTEDGREAVARGVALWLEAQASLKEYLGEEDLAKLTALLAKLEALVP